VEPFYDFDINDPARDLDSAALGRVSHLAAQPELGVLSEWRTGPNVVILLILVLMGRI
jgi:hypothetical protein